MAVHLQGILARIIKAAWGPAPADTWRVSAFVSGDRPDAQAFCLKSAAHTLWTWGVREKSWDSGGRWIEAPGLCPLTGSVNFIYKMRKRTLPSRGCCNNSDKAFKLSKGRKEMSPLLALPVCEGGTDEDQSPGSSLPRPWLAIPSWAVTSVSKFLLQ